MAERGAGDTRPVLVLSSSTPGAPRSPDPGLLSGNSDSQPWPWLGAALVQAPMDLMSPMDLMIPRVWAQRSSLAGRNPRLVQLLSCTLKLQDTQPRLCLLFHLCLGSSPPAGIVNWEGTPQLCSGQKHSPGEDAQGSREGGQSQGGALGCW